MSDTSRRCLVDEYSYDLYVLIPSIAIILGLGFMKKRVRLSPGLCNGRPAIPVPVDFLGKDKNRFVTVLAFGATAASCFAMFYDTINSGNTSYAAASKNIPKTPWGKAFRGILMTLVFGIMNFPYLACLNTDYKVIGYAIGLVYTFIRLIVNLFLYFGCSFDDETTQRAKEHGLGHLIYIKLLINLPAVICTALLVCSYAVLLYRELRKCRTNNTGQNYRGILNPETDNDECVAEETDRNHVMMLLANKLHRKRIQEYEPFYVTLKNKIYESRPDFKFSTQFLSAFLVSFLFVYQITVLIIAGVIVPYKSYSEILGKNNLKWKMIAILLDYVLTAVILACFITVLQLLFLLKSHRNDVLRTYRNKKGLLPDEILHPKMLVGKGLRFCGYQIALTAIGFLFLALALMLVLSIIYGLKVLDMMLGREVVLEWVKEFVLLLLPIIVAPLLIWISLVLMSIFVFHDKTYPDLTIQIDNRRLYGIVAYFFFFLNILVGLWSGISRVVKGAVLGLVFLCRLDRTPMMTGYRKWDKGYMAYIGFLNVLVAFRHPVMLCFCQLLLDETRSKKYSGNTPTRYRVSSKSLNRWFLAVMLMRNPSLVRYRRKKSLTCQLLWWRKCTPTYGKSVNFY